MSASFRRPAKYVPLATFTGFSLAAALAFGVNAGPREAAARDAQIPASSLALAAELRERALRDTTSWQVVESLTTEIGPRLAGSEADARAVRWAEAKFKALGYDRVWLEEVTFPKWVRRSERGEVIGTDIRGEHAQALTLTALGGSVGGTVEAEIVRFETLAALEAAPAGSLNGKIAFVDYLMARSRDGSGYGPSSRLRGRGPSAAIRAGASAFVMRSAGTDWHRNPHTGITRYDEGLTPIPAAALALPDADQLTRLLARGKPVRVRIALDCGWDGTATSHNVIGEVLGSKAKAAKPGASKPARAKRAGSAAGAAGINPAEMDDVVLIGAHLDSWDLGTGAIDDGAGIGITMAAGHLIARLPKAQRPARTIRVVAFANEEQGLYGGKAYAERYAAAVAKHQVVAESDFGAGRIYAFNSNAAPHARNAVRQIAEALQPLGIEYAEGKGGPGPDLGPIVAKGAVWAWLAQDGTDYFDLHHTPDDTLDKIDSAALAQNTAAYTVFAYLAASADGDFGSAPKAAEPAPGTARP